MIAVRLAEANDIETMFDIRTGVRQNRLSREQLQETGITPAALSASVASGEHRAWIAEIDSTPAAFAMADPGEGSVFAMFVRPEFEGRGLGRKLMAEAEAFLFRRHSKIHLTTDGSPDVRANGFYRALGWKPVLILGNGDIRYEKSVDQA